MKRSLALHSGDLFPEQYQRGAKIKYSGPGLLPAPFTPVVVGLGLFPSLFFRFLTCLTFFFLILTFWTFLGDKWKWGPCSTSSLQQFHDRYLEYLMFAREKELDPDFPLESKRLESLTYEERKAIIEVNGYHSLARYPSYSSNRYFLIAL